MVKNCWQIKKTSLLQNNYNNIVVMRGDISQNCSFNSVEAQKFLTNIQKVEFISS